MDDQVENGVKWYKEKKHSGDFNLLGSFDRSISYRQVLAELKENFKVEKGDTVMIRDDAQGVIEIDLIEPSDVRLRILNQGNYGMKGAERG